jgi:hypothetical protein
MTPLRSLRPWVPALICALAVLETPAAARADGLSPLAEGPAGPYSVAVLATPSPLTTGASRWDVIVRPAPPRDAVTLVLRLTPEHSPPAPERVEVALSPVPRAPGRWSGDTALQTEGPWRGEAWVRSKGSTDVLHFTVDVARARSSLEQHGLAIALAPLGVLCFGLHQWRVHRRPSRGSAEKHRASRSA